MIPEGRFETSRISPGNTSKLLKIHISNFHRISIFLAEVRLASGPCLESRLLFFSQLSHYSLSLSLSSLFFSLAFYLRPLHLFHKPDRDSRLGNGYSYGFSRGVVLALYLPVILMSIHAIPVGWPPWPPWFPLGLHPGFCLALPVHC